MLLNKNSQEGEINKKSFFTAKFINPESVIEQLDLRKGMVVVDFGSGAGYFTLPIAKKIEDGGKAYALDVVSQKLGAVLSRAKSQGLNNIITKRVNLENEKGSGLENESVDCVIMKDMLFQNKKKEQIIEEARRILKIGGKVLIVEWSSTDFSIGPEKNLRISKEIVMSLAQKKGLTFLKEINAGNFHYGLIFEAV